jgi:hypothetical protein
MKTLAALLVQLGKPLVLADIEIPALKLGHPRLSPLRQYPVLR